MRFANRSTSGHGRPNARRIRWEMALIWTCAFFAFSALAQTVDAPEERPVGLAQFTTAVENREPIDQVSFLDNQIDKVFFYSELRGMDGQTIHHRWLYSGEVMANVKFEIGGPRWRVWSSKDLQPDWIGDWTVEIVAADGQVLAAETFTYSAPDA
jgi:hypothetical protein